MSNTVVALTRSRFEKIEADTLAELRQRKGRHAATDPVQAALSEYDRLEGATGRQAKDRDRLFRLAMTAIASRRTIELLYDLDEQGLAADQVSLVCRLVETAFSTGHHQLRHAALIGFGQQAAGKNSRETKRFAVDRRHQKWVDESKRLRDHEGVKTQRERARRIADSHGVGFETVRKALQAHNA